MRKPKKQNKPLNDLSRSPTPFDPNRTLIAVIELSKESWHVAGIVPGVERQPLKKLAAGENGLLRLLERWRAEAEKAGRSRPSRRRMPSAPTASATPSLTTGPVSSTASRRPWPGWASATSIPSSKRRRSAWSTCARPRASPSRPTPSLNYAATSSESSSLPSRSGRSRVCACSS